MGPFFTGGVNSIGCGPKDVGSFVFMVHDGTCHVRVLNEKKE